MGWINFVKALRASWTTSPSFSSPFYYVSIIIAVVLSVGLIFLNKYKLKDKAYKYILLGVWIVMLILEFFKQIIGSYCEVGSGLEVHYAWPFLPIHICSAALFLLPIIIFMKDCKAKKAFELYYSICLFLGGGLALASPSFNHIIYLTWQTCIYHILLFSSALLVGLRTRSNFKINILGEAFGIYAGFLLIALFFNWICNFHLPAHPQGWNVNFWELAWWKAPSIPLLDKLWGVVPYPVYLLVFIHVHIAAAVLVYVLLSLIYNHKVTFKYVKEDKKLNKKKSTTSKR